jgi:hypothetical protein
VKMKIEIFYVKRMEDTMKVRILPEEYQEMGWRLIERELVTFFVLPEVTEDPREWVFSAFNHGSGVEHPLLMDSDRSMSVGDAMVLTMGEIKRTEICLPFGWLTITQREEF